MRSPSSLWKGAMMKEPTEEQQSSAPESQDAVMPANRRWASPHQSSMKIFRGPQAQGDHGSGTQLPPSVPRIIKTKSYLIFFN